MMQEYTIDDIRKYIAEQQRGLIDRYGEYETSKDHEKCNEVSEFYNAYVKILNMLGQAVFPTVDVLGFIEEEVNLVSWDTKNSSKEDINVCFTSDIIRILREARWKFGATGGLSDAGRKSETDTQTV